MEEEPKYIVLPDLDKKIDEAIYDAINFFQKKCPFCGNLLFTGHIRTKIHVDHFIPIARGGQHVPWNILPVCQKCNSKKHSKKPQTFLTTHISELCEQYLDTVKAKYIGEIQRDLEKYAQIKMLFSTIDSTPQLKKNITEIVNTIYEIVKEQPLVEPKVSEETLPKIHYNVEKLIAKFCTIPNSEDSITKYSATEITRAMEVFFKIKLRRSIISKTLKEMGFYYCLERIDSQEIKRVFYVSLINN